LLRSAAWVFEKPNMLRYTPHPLGETLAYLRCAFPLLNISGSLGLFRYTPLGEATLKGSLRLALLTFALSKS
jgi:hypothetical protein